LRIARSSHLKLFSPSNSHRGRRATEFKAGDYFGEFAFIATVNKILRDRSSQDAYNYNFLPDQSTRVADVVATSTSRILELSVRDFVSIVVSA
jgi:CRP-like cAMP-binding protein